MINSIESLLQKIEDLKRINPDNQLFFRGQSEKFPDITPSIYRNNYIQNEDILYKECILRNPDEFKDEQSTFEKLAKMQHYKLPTRLLDITSNPLIGLYFAVEDESKHGFEGDFIIFSIPDNNIKYYDSDTVSAVANISKRPVGKLNISRFTKGGKESNQDFIKRFNDSKEIQYLLHEIKEEKPYFKDIIKKEHLESIWCVKPLLKNRRIIKQDGAFLLFGINGNKSKMAAYNDFSPDRVPVEEKKALKEKLQLLGISKDKVFPELDTTSEFLREHYNYT